jgi:hypothetical protein
MSSDTRQPNPHALDCRRNSLSPAYPAPSHRQTQREAKDPPSSPRARKQARLRAGELGCCSPKQLSDKLDDLRARERRRGCRVSSLSDSTSRLASLAYLRIGGFSHLARRVRSRHTPRAQLVDSGGGPREIPPGSRTLVGIRAHPSQARCGPRRRPTSGCTGREPPLLFRESYTRGVRFTPVNRKPLADEANVRVVGASRLQVRSGHAPGRSGSQRSRDHERSSGLRGHSRAGV